MRAFALCLTGVAAFASLAAVACSQEEFPNPPATRNGTEDTQQSPGAALPGESDPNAKPKPAPTTSTPTSPPTDPPDPPALPNGPTSGVDQSKTVGELSSTEKKQLCDWHAGINGGYNKKTTCSGVTVSGPKSQADCVQDLTTTCQATIADVESCFNLDAKDPCAFAVFKAPECEAVRQCAK